MMRFLRGLGVAFLACAALQAGAQGTYPTKPVRLVVPFPPGGPSDATARALSVKLSESLGQQVIVENKPGANTIIGADLVAKSPADGYTLLFATDATLSINPLLYSKLPYNAQRDYTPVSIALFLPEYLMIRSDIPAKNLQEFIAYVKARPGKINFGSFGPGSNAHIAAEAINAAAGTQLVHVPYKGAAEVIPAMLSGDIQMVVTSAAQAMPYIKTGQIKPIAVMSQQRTRALPEVETFTEGGLPGFDTRVWFGVVAPAQTPPAIVKRLSDEISRIVTAPEYAEKALSPYAMEPVATPGPEFFARTLANDRDKYARYVKAANVRLD